MSGSAPAGPPGPRRRVRVTSPLAHAPAHQRRSAREEIDQSTAMGEVYVRSLVRAQLRAALVVIGAVTLTVGILPLVFWHVGPIRDATVGRVPLVWIVLGVAIYPWVWWLGHSFVQRAERNEVRFAALIDSPTDPVPPEPEDPDEMGDAR